MRHREVRLGGTNVPVHVRGQLRIRSGGHISAICVSPRSSLRASFGQVCSLEEVGECLLSLLTWFMFRMHLYF